MSNKLLLASLAALAASSAFAVAVNADPTPGAKPTPAPLPTCTTGGDVVFSIDHKSDEASQPQWKFELLSKGMYTITGVQNGKPVTATGCAGTPNVSRILTALKGVKWELTRHEFTCQAYSPNFTVYAFGGRSVFTQRLCNSTSLDEASRQALDTAIAIVKPFDVLPATPPSPPPSPPKQP